MRDQMRLFIRVGENPLPQGFNSQIIPIFPPGSVKQILNTRIGDGPQALNGEKDGMLNEEGLPKRLL
jgi:hypothetical protein